MGDEAVGDVRRTKANGGVRVRAPVCVRLLSGTGLGAGVRH
jgi:hypothetical protein